MGAALDYFDAAVRDAINETVYVVDVAAPETLQLVFQGLRFADAAVRVAFDIFQKLFDAL